MYGPWAVLLHHDAEVPHDVDPTEARGHVTVGWRLPDGSEDRAPFVLIGGTMTP
ncbi:hypothetical protein ACW4TU_15460 [Streptomyces sp. QTS52]